MGAVAVGRAPGHQDRWRGLLQPYLVTVSDEGILRQSGAEMSRGGLGLSRRVPGDSAAPPSPDSCRHIAASHGDGFHPARVFLPRTVRGSNDQPRETHISDRLTVDEIL